MQYRVTTRVTDLRIRAGPGTHFHIIGGLARNSTVEVLDDQSRGRWKKLATGGWAYAGDHGEFLTPVVAGSALGAEAAGAIPLPKHMLLFFGGLWEDGPAGTDLSRTDRDGQTRTSALAYDAVARLFPAPHFAHGWNPAKDNTMHNPTVNTGFTVLRQGLNLAGKLVIYGFSAGGFNALRLCERIAGDPEMRQRQVDLLITIDPCLQLMPGHESFTTRTPRPPVLRHINYYQTVDEMRGRSMTEAEVNRLINPPPRPPSRTPGMTPPRPSRVNHDRMPMLTLDHVVREISMILRE